MAQASWQRGAALAFVSLPDPEPKALEVRVRVRAAGVNPVDWKMRTMGPLRLAARLIGPKAPIVFGIDFMGVIDAVGSAVSTFSIGDRVAGGTIFARGQRGSAADTVCVRTDQIVKVPAHVSDDVAGCLAVTGASAKISLFDLGRLPQDGRVLVLGASGGVGQLVVQLARHARNATVVGVCSGKNAALVRKLGCAQVIDYGAGDALVLAKEHGPYDVVVDCVGSYAGAGCRALLGARGRHVIVSGDSALAMLQPLVPPFQSRLLLSTPKSEHLQPVMDAIAAGGVSIAIAQRFPLEAIEQAHQLSITGRMTGRLVLIL